MPIALHHCCSSNDFVSVGSRRIHDDPSDLSWQAIEVQRCTARAEWIKVEAVGLEKRSFKNCIPIVGDQHWTTVSWKDHDELGREPGTIVTLRALLRQAKRYGLEFE